MQNIASWFTEKIRDKVTIAVQANGGLLDNTFMVGDETAGTVKFPIVNGSSTMYKLTGAIEPVPINAPGVSTVSLLMDDYEDTQFWRTQDAYKSGPSEQQALADLMAMGVRRKRDAIRLDALDAFYTLDGGANITTIGGGAVVPDILHFERARAELASYGDNGDMEEVFTTISEMEASQLSLYKEWANTQWGSLSGNGWSTMQRFKMKTVRNVTYIVVPDSYVRSPAGQPTQRYGFMWRKSALGANTVYNQEQASMSIRTDLQGDPYQMKTKLAAAAIGIQAKCVRRMLFAKITDVVRGP